MTVSLATFIGAAAVGVLLPAQLNRLRVVGIAPSFLIAGWALSIAGVLTAAAAAVVMLIVPGHSVPGGPLAAASSCWSSVRHGVPPRVEELSGVLTLIIVTAGAARFAVIGTRFMRRRGRSRRERLAVLRLAARVEPGSPTILWLAHDRPLAFSLSGRPSFLVATDGLRRQLTTSQADAVLEHERAHVRHHHHLLVSLADLSKAALPFLPLFRAAPRAVRELVELAADDTAVRRFGATTVRSALLGVAGGGSPENALAFGRDALEARLNRLATPPQPTTWRRRGLAYAFVGVSALLPFVTGAVVLVAVSALSCGGL